MAKFLKSAEENENQFELDEQAINEISNAEEFADVEITHEDIMDAVQAIDAVADAVIEKADAEEKEVDADAVLEQVTDVIENTHDDDVEISEEEELPEEITNSVVRVMVSEDGAVELEQSPDEIHDETVDGLDCTVFDTCDVPEIDVEETGDPEKAEDDVLIIGNSKSAKFKKGFVTIKSNANKKCWSAAFKKVKSMIGNAKMTAAHWAIVSALAKKEESEVALKNSIQSKVLAYIKNNAELKNKFFKAIKSELENDVQPEISKEGQTEAETKPTETAGTKNGVTEPKTPTETGKPEGIEQPSGNPTEDPNKQNEREGEIALPEESIVVVEVPLTNSVRKVQLQKIRSSKNRGYNLYKVVSNKDMSFLDGRVISCGKIAYAFQNTTQGILACCAKYENTGKGIYKPVMSGKTVVIGKGVKAPVFQNYEKIMMAKAIVSARRQGVEEGKKALTSGRNRVSKRPLTSARRPVLTPERKAEILARREARLNGKAPVNSSRMHPQNRTDRKAIQSKIELLKAKKAERKAIESKAELQKMHEAEERARLFQSSQTQMNEEKIAIKSNNARNTAALNSLYDKMF